MGGLFGLGSVCFVVGAGDALGGWVSAHFDAVAFVVGAVLFTAGGLTQSWLAFPERSEHRRGRLAWHSAWIQSAGTLLFNLMTIEGLSAAAATVRYDLAVWIPNAAGSLCFLVSGVLLYLSAPRRGWRPLERVPGWWEPPVNLFGCVLFAVSALAGFGDPIRHRLLDAPLANWTTSFGAACFLAVGLAPLLAGRSFKVPRLSRLIAAEHALDHDLGRVAATLEGGFRAARRELD